MLRCQISKKGVTNTIILPSMSNMYSNKETLEELETADDFKSSHATASGAALPLELINEEAKVR